MTTPGVGAGRTRLLGIALVATLVLGALAPAATGAFVTEGADLYVEQPHYIGDSVRVESPPPNSSSNVSTYHARGAVLDIAPKNFPESAVTEFGIASGPGTLEFDERLGVYKFRPDKSGTYELYWLVREERVVGNESELVTVRYAARLRVNVTDRSHIPAAELEGMRDDAESWNNLVDRIKSEDVVGPDADVANALDGAITYLRFMNGHVLEVLSGRLSAQLLALFITVPGLIIVATGVLLHYLSRREDVTEIHETRKLDEKRADLEEVEDNAKRYERTAALSSLDFNDAFPDDVARTLRDAVGRDFFEGWLALSGELTGERLTRDRLRVLEESHYAVEDGSAVTDGGDTTVGGRQETDARYRLVPKDQVPDSEKFDGGIRAVDADDDEILDGVAWDDPALLDVDADEIVDDPDTTLAAPTLDELLEAYGSDELEKETWLKYMAESVGVVADHDFTDDKGRVRPPRLVLNLWLRMSRYIGDREGVPLARYQAEYLEALLATYDREAEVRNEINRTLREGV